MVSDCAPLPPSGLDRPRPPPSGSRVNTGSGEVGKQRPDQPVPGPASQGAAPSSVPLPQPAPRRALLLGQRPRSLGRYCVGLAPDPEVGPAAGISRPQALIPDEPRVNPDRPRGRRGLLAPPSSVPRRGASRGLEPTPRLLAAFGETRVVSAVGGGAGQEMKKAGPGSDAPRAWPRGDRDVGRKGRDLSGSI